MSRRDPSGCVSVVAIGVMLVLVTLTVMLVRGMW